MPVQKRSKGSSKSKKPIRRRTMRGGDITEKMIAYLKSKNITDEQITDAISAAEPEPATDDSLLNTFSNETDITKADYQKWSNVKSYPVVVEPEEADEEEAPANGAPMGEDGELLEADEEEAPANGAPMGEDGVANGVAPMEEDGAAELPVAPANGAPIPPEITAVLEEVAKELSGSPIKKGGYKKIQRQKKKGGAFALPTEPTQPTGDNIEEVDFKPSSFFNMSFTTSKSNKLTIFKEDVSEYQHIIRFIIAKNALTNTTQQPINKKDIKAINTLMNSVNFEDKTTLLRLLQQYAGYINNMVLIMSLYNTNPKPPGYQYLVNTYAYLDTILKKQFGKLVPTSDLGLSLDDENAVAASISAALDAAIGRDGDGAPRPVDDAERDQLVAAAKAATVKLSAESKARVKKVVTDAVDHRLRTDPEALDRAKSALTEIFTDRAAVGGGKRKSKSRRGGFLDTTRIYNAQGLLSDAIDPLTAASTAGAEVERVPLPFSSRGSGTINYESDINKDFIADLLPSLGKSGGAKKSKKTRK